MLRFEISLCRSGAMRRKEQGTEISWGLWVEDGKSAETFNILP